MWGRRIAARNAQLAAASIKPVATAAPKAEKQWGKPKPLPKREFNPLAEDICCELRPTIPVGEMTLRQWIRYQAISELIGEKSIHVLISAGGRGGKKGRKERQMRAVLLATWQFAADAIDYLASRVLFRWALTFKVYPVGLLENGDFEMTENVAYRLLKWAEARQHPRLEELKTVYQLNNIHPEAPASPVVAVDVPYDEIEQIAIDVGIDPIALRARETAPIAKPTVTDDEDTDDEVTASPGTKVVTVKEDVKAVTPEPTPIVAKPVEAPKPTMDKAVIVSVPSKDERIAAKAAELAKAKGHDYATAVSAIRSHYRNEARRLLKL